MICLPPKLVKLFKEKLVSGELNPEKLAQMSSEERRTVFNFLGEPLAKEVNALFESKLLLKSQQTGMINWAKQVVGMKPEVLKDIVSRVNKMTEVLQPETKDTFLADLAAHKLGVTVTMEEAGKIAELAKSVEDTKVKISQDSPIGSQERLDYGSALVAMKDYVGQLKLGEKKINYLNPIEASGLFKSLLSTLDNSFFGRQGIRTLYTHPSTWAKAFIKSWGDIGKELKGQDAISPIKADIYSRPNALNGNYSRMKLDIGIDSEEAFPSQLPEKIPLFGRVFKGAEAAFNGAAMRIRADLADQYVKLAEEQGVNLSDRITAEGLGQLINSITGRGKIPASPGIQKGINATFFSIKYLKSLMDSFTQPLNKNLDPFVRKQAALNLLKVAGGIAAVNTVANLLQPGSAERDPRGSGFGKIKVGNTFVDTTGGLASLATFASRLTPSMHDGKWGFWSLNTRTGKWTDLTGGKYGQQTALDVFNSFWEGKLSPLAGLARDIWNGQNYNGQKVTIQNALPGLVEPLSLQNFQQIMNSPDADKALFLMVAEGLGFNTSSPMPKKK